MRPSEFWDMTYYEFLMCREGYNNKKEKQNDLLDRLVDTAAHLVASLMNRIPWFSKGKPVTYTGDKLLGKEQETETKDLSDFDSYEEYKKYMSQGGE